LLKKIKKILVNWLLKDVEIEKLKIGNETVTISTSIDMGGGDILGANWIVPTYIGPRSDTTTYTYFRTKNIAGTSAVTHYLTPTDDAYGAVGIATKRFGGGSFVYGYIWNMRLQGASTSYMPYDSSTHHTLCPYTDAYSYVGTATNRFSLIRGVTITSGDLAFEERYCLVCGKKFREGDSVVLKVIAVEDEECQMRTVPVHAECNPHPIKPEMLKKHMEMLKPNRGNLPEEFKPKTRLTLKEGEYEVLSITPVDENAVMFNIILWDATTLSIPLPPGVSEEQLEKAIAQYYKLAKEREAEEKRKSALAKLQKPWIGFKGQIKKEVLNA
jgi:hypothetical protein